MLFLPREDGQGLVEYALILLFIALVVLVVLVVFGPELGSMYSDILGMFPD